jgi:hypothetical protein
MNTLSVNFETWPLWDGYYSPFKTGDEQEFVLFPRKSKIRKARKRVFYLQKKKHSRYAFCGRIIRNYMISGRRMIIVNTGYFNVLMWYQKIEPRLRKGQYVEGMCELAVDSDFVYWSIEDLVDPPKIEYKFLINRIRGVIFPEENFDDDDVFGLIFLSPDQFTSKNMVEIDDIEKDTQGSHMYLLEMTCIGEPKPDE